jgi:hypothetical protein
MYLKCIAGSDNITYRSSFREPLSENYVEAAEFIQKLFTIKNNITIPVMDKPTLIAPITLSFSGILNIVIAFNLPGILRLMGIILGLTNLVSAGVQFLRNGIPSCFNYRLNCIRITKKDQNNHGASAVIIHETLHYLTYNKALPQSLTLWAARAVDLIYPCKITGKRE